MHNTVRLVFLGKTLLYCDNLTDVRVELEKRGIVGKVWEDIIYTDESTITVCVRGRLLGGKGGFGSNLRAQGNKMSSKKRAGNYEACRDLSGRRIRSVHQAEKISEYLKAAPLIKKAKNDAIRTKMEGILDLTAQQKSQFQDVEYIKRSQEVIDDVELSVLKALKDRCKASSSNAQRKRYYEKDIESDDCE